MNVIEVEGLTVHYDKNPVLWDLTFSLPAGIICGIAGPNGAGKSTLLKAAVSLVKPSAGKVSFFGEPFSRIRRKVAYIPQRESIDWDFPIIASDVVMMGRYHQFNAFGRPRPEDREVVARVLERVGMSGFSSRQIGQLSGGQQQRLFIARALAQEPDLFLLDEPFRGVDLTTERAMISIFQELKKEGKTILIVFHDLVSAEHYFDWLILLNHRLISCGPLAETFTLEHLQQTFGRGHALFEDATLLSAKMHSGLEE